jgi:hypothetical protein
MLKTKLLLLPVLLLIGCGLVQEAQPNEAAYESQLATIVTSAAGGGTSGTGDRTATITPSTSELIVAFASFSDNTQAAPVMTDNRGGTYVFVARASWSGGGNNSAVYVRNTLTTTRSSHVVKLDTDTNSAGEIVLISVAGMDRTGAVAVRQVGISSDQASSTTPAVTFGATTLTSSVVLGGVASADTTTTPPSGWTERKDASQATPTTALEVATKDSGYTSSTVTWGASQSTAYAAIAIELDTSPPPNDLGFAHGINVQGYGSAIGPVKITRDTTSGNTFLVVLGGNHSDIDDAPTDTYGNTWTLVGIDDYTDWPGYGSAVWAATNATGGSSHTFSQTVTAFDELTMFLVEVPAGATPTVLSSFTQKANSVGGTTMASASITTSAPARFVSFWYGAGNAGSGNHTAATNTGTGLDGYGFDDPNGYVQAFDSIEDQATAGTYNHTWTYSPGQGTQVREIAIQ